MQFNKDVLKIDSKKEIQRITEFITDNLSAMNRNGIVVGLSGGIDSALIAALCVEAIGKDKVFGLILPEKDSSPRSSQFAEKEAQRLGIETETVDITPFLESFGTYQKRDSIVQSIFPEYNDDCKLKITLPGNILESNQLNIFKLNMINEKGETKTARPGKKELNGIIAASNTKQRTRMLTLYYYAELKHYLVCGTTNRSETIQGFFVKYGDGGVDLEPIAHLYKTQVYQLARQLDISKEIIERKPTPDTYSAEVSDEEFYFRIPFEKLDLLLYAWENEIPVEQVCRAMDLSREQVERVFRDFKGKYSASKHMRELPPSLD